MRESTARVQAEGVAEPVGWDTGRPLPLATILLYAAPIAGIGFMEIFFAMYLMKFSTDVLAVAPAAMGVIFLLARIGGGISDPVAGFLSDRTRTRLGRRRPWLLASALPLVIVFALMWSPPAGLSTSGMVIWMGAMVILFQMGINVYTMPHDALGAELSDEYHDRNRIFGTRRIVFGVGALAVFGAVARLASSPDPRGDAALIGVAAATVTAVLMLYMGVTIREREEYQGRGAASPFQALVDVWRNEHARLLLLVFFVQQLGVGTVTIAAAYHTQYVLGSGESLPLVLGSFIGVSILSVPVWVRLGRRFDKKPMLVVSMALVCLAMGGIFFVGEGDLALFLIMAGIGGFAGGGADVVFPSLSADVIDYDEYRTGQRKEGMYFAAWNFVAKTGLGLTGVATGAVLAASGFQPNQEQTESAKLAIRMLMSVQPLICYGAGALLFLRFGLTRKAHAEIRRKLDERQRTP